MKIEFSDEITKELMGHENKRTPHLFWLKDGAKLIEVTARVINKGSKSDVVREVGFDFSHTGFCISDKGRGILENKDYTCSRYTIRMHLLPEEIVLGMHILRMELHFTDVFEREECI